MSMKNPKTGTASSTISGKSLEDLRRDLRQIEADAEKDVRAWTNYEASRMAGKSTALCSAPEFTNSAFPNASILPERFVGVSDFTGVGIMPAHFNSVSSDSTNGMSMSEPTKKRIVIGESGPFGCSITAPAVFEHDMPNGMKLRWRKAGDHFVLEAPKVSEDGCHWEWVEVPCVVGDIPEK